MITTVPESHRARRVFGGGGGCTLDCPIGDCGRPAQAWISDALVDGYVDSCRLHAQDIMDDAIEVQNADLAQHPEPEGSAS
jgi:hypothetical protein